MIKLTDAIRTLLNDNPGPGGVVCVVGTAALHNGYPQLSPKGSVIAYSDDCLAFWERSGRSTAKLIQENPRITIYYRNKERGSGLFPAGVLRFYGDVEILPDGPQRDRIYGMIPEHERKPDPGKTGKAVLVHLQRVEDLNGNILMQRD
jgi:Pyridoxamine 5'-phosphate oxidase